MFEAFHHPQDVPLVVINGVIYVAPIDILLTKWMTGVLVTPINEVITLTARSPLCRQHQTLSPLAFLMADCKGGRPAA